MTLKLYNSLTRKKEAFEREKDENGEYRPVRMYVCGPTVYDRPHIGNARAVVVYDVLFRLLRHLYGEEHVTYARNITDVDDKIMVAAKERGIPISQLTREVTEGFHADMAALNCLAPTHEPRATEYIGKMVEMIEKLIANGNAYAAEGHVLFDVTSSIHFPLEGESKSAQRDSVGGKKSTKHKAQSTSTPHDSAANASVLASSAPPQGGSAHSWHYGILSGRTVEEQQAGARVEVEGYKRHPGDFVLWKPAEAGDDESAVFDSPWGKGRPGWHIECSAMSTDLLGENFDIHGGGADLKFPHHENEIAQSCCANPGSHFAKIWVHNGFLTVNGEKMSKSLGNFVTVTQLLQNRVRGEVIRYALLSARYSEPLDWNDRLLSSAKKSLDRLYRMTGDLEFHSGVWNPAEYLDKQFMECLYDDMNFPAALAILRQFAREATMINTVDQQARIEAQKKLKACAGLLGLLQQDAEAWAKGELSEGEGDHIINLATDMLRDVAKGKITLSEEERALVETLHTQVDTLLIENKINARTAAKAAKNWAEADRIRDELKAQGIILEDRPDGTTDWRRA